MKAQLQLHIEGCAGRRRRTPRVGLAFKSGRPEAGGPPPAALREVRLREALRDVIEHDGWAMAEAIVRKERPERRGRPRAQQPSEGLKRAVRHYAKYPRASMGKLAQIAGMKVPAISKHLKDPAVQDGMLGRLAHLKTVQTLRALGVEGGEEMEEEIVAALTQLGLITREEVEAQRRAIVETLNGTD